MTLPETRTLGGMTARTASRIFSAGFGLATGTVLALSAWLTPSPLGHSTHTQLGLGKCSFLALTGFPCPMCGMTTTFTLMAHFHPLDALLNQPFGVILFLLTVLMFGISVAEVVQPRDRWSRLLRRLAPRESQLATLFLIGMGLGWMYKIALIRGMG